MTKPGLSIALVLFAAATASADTTPQTLPYSQDWTDPGLITTNDDWSGVPGVVGYKDDLAGSTTAVDPQTIVAPQTTVDVIANQSSGSLSTGGVAEFDQLANPVVGLNGSGTADAPYISFFITTTSRSSIRVRYNVRDLDPSADNAIQPVALQFRVGNSGDFTNVPAGFVADATEVDADTKVTAVDATLPAAADNQALVEIRVITSNALGADEYVGIDDVQITGTFSGPTGVGSATPSSLAAGAQIELNATITAGTSPASTGITVSCDAAQIGAGTVTLVDDGTNGDDTANDGIYSRATTVAAATTAGTKMLGCTVADAQTRSSTFTITFTVEAVCGDGVLEGAEVCDDGDDDPNDGCSATCTVETGYSCTTASPSVCSDIDECTTATDNCSDNARCDNTAGSFTCTCNDGFSGNGVTCADVDECMANTDDCDANAACMNTAGSFTCTCNDGYSGSGQACADIDECTTNADDCDANATCGNTPGDFTCTCNDGFEGDGRTCTSSSTCGNGVVDGSDACDDSNTTAGDGCSDTCAVEPNFVCAGTPSVCRADGDGDGVANVDDSCPSIPNADQEDSDGNGIGDACEAEDEGGCCSTSHDSGAGAWLLGLATLIGLRRRRRS